MWGICFAVSSLALTASTDACTSTKFFGEGDRTRDIRVSYNHQSISVWKGAIVDYTLSLSEVLQYRYVNQTAPGSFSAVTKGSTGYRCHVWASSSGTESHNWALDVSSLAPKFAPSQCLYVPDRGVIAVFGTESLLPGGWRNRLFFLDSSTLSVTKSVTLRSGVEERAHIAVNGPQTVLAVQSGWTLSSFDLSAGVPALLSEIEFEAAPASRPSLCGAPSEYNFHFIPDTDLIYSDRPGIFNLKTGALVSDFALFASEEAETLAASSGLARRKYAFLHYSSDAGLFVVILDRLTMQTSRFPVSGTKYDLLQFGFPDYMPPLEMNLDETQASVYFKNGVALSIQVP